MTARPVAAHSRWAATARLAWRTLLGVALLAAVVGWLPNPAYAESPHPWSSAGRAVVAIQSPVLASSLPDRGVGAASRAVVGASSADGAAPQPSPGVGLTSPELRDGLAAADSLPAGPMRPALSLECPAVVGPRGPPTTAGPAPTTPPLTSAAANGGVRAIEASTRVAPWAGSSLSRLSTAGEKMYRVWGGSADQAGSWLTPIRPSSAAAAREGLALPAEDAATYVSEVTLPAGIRMQVGTAGPAFGQPGGWAQAQLLERIPLSSFGKGELLP